MRYSFWDTETASLEGPTPESSGVAEVACLEFNEHLEILDHWSELCNPGRPIEPGASAINGITDEMVADKPPLAEVMARRWDDSPTVFVAHNAPFDIKFLGEHIEVADTLCTLALSRQHIRGTTNHKLGTLITELNLIPGGTAHTAGGDTLGGFNLLKGILKITGRGLQDLIVLSRKRLFMHTVPFGKYKNWSWHDVPIGYLQWLLREDFPPDMKYTAEQALKGRVG